MAIVCSILLLCHAAMAASEGDIARINTVKGAASIERQAEAIPAKAGQRIYQGDTLKTGADGSLGVIFKDNTILSLGPESTIVIDEFLFNPAEDKLSFVTRLIRGTAACLTGVIAKLAPQAVRFETPVARVGLRGTKFLVSIEEEGKP
jgi:hypothetical protein